MACFTYGYNGVVVKLASSQVTLFYILRTNLYLALDLFFSKKVLRSTVKNYYSIKLYDFIFGTLLI